MELVAGRHLAGPRARPGAVAHRRGGGLRACRSSKGLEAAQRIGILHRDVKPSNCYVGEDGAVKIGDFGLSISTAVRTEPALTATGAFLGTPAFCSPEQLRGEELNARSDMYSVGATLFYLLTGRTPFEAPNMVQLLATVLEQRAPSPRKFRPEVPQGLAKVVLRCLEKQPGERFKNYADLARALAPYSSTAPDPGDPGPALPGGSGGYDAPGRAGDCDQPVGVWIADGFYGAGHAAFAEDAGLHARMVLCDDALLCAVRGPVGRRGGQGPLPVARGRAGPESARLRAGLAPRAGLRRAAVRCPTGWPLARIRKAYMSASPWTQMLLGFSIYAIMALLFVTARRRNGFAAVQDLLTGTRVISRAAVSSRPVLPASEAPPPAVESAITIGPYHVLQALTESAGEKWFLALRPEAPAQGLDSRGAPGHAAGAALRLRSLGRVGRLRWLTGKRSPEENWDAFEAPERPALPGIGRQARNRGARCVTGFMIWPRKSAPRRRTAPCLNSPSTASGSPAKAGPSCSTSPPPALRGSPKAEIRRPNQMQTARLNRLKASSPRWPRRHWKGLGRPAPRPPAMWRCRCRCTRAPS